MQLANQNKKTSSSDMPRLGIIPEQIFRNKLLEMDATFGDLFRAIKRVEVSGHWIEVEQAPPVFGGEDPLGTGSTVWRGADLATLPELRGFVEGRHILELGAGTGIAGLACAALGAKAIVLTDRPDLVPLLDRNRKRNAWVETIGGCKVSVAPLTWPASIRDLAALLADGPLDCVIGADVVYHQDHVKPLAETLLGLLSLMPYGHDISGILACDKQHEPLAYAAFLNHLRGAVVTPPVVGRGGSPPGGGEMRRLSCDRHSLSDDGRFEIILLRQTPLSSEEEVHRDDD